MVHDTESERARGFTDPVCSAIPAGRCCQDRSMRVGWRAAEAKHRQTDRKNGIELKKWERHSFWNVFLF